MFGADLMNCYRFCAVRIKGSGDIRLNRLSRCTHIAQPAMQDQVLCRNGSGAAVVLCNSNPVPRLQFYIIISCIYITQDMQRTAFFYITVSILHRRRGGKIHRFPCAVDDDAACVRSRNHNRPFFLNRHADKVTVFIVPGKFPCLRRG